MLDRLNEWPEEKAIKFLEDMEEIIINIKGRGGVLSGANNAYAWIKCADNEPPTDEYILTYHQLDRIQMQKYSGAYFNDPITCPVDERGNPIGFTSHYPKSVITHWMPLPDPPKI